MGMVSLTLQKFNQRKYLKAIAYMAFNLCSAPGCAR